MMTKFFFLIIFISGFSSILIAQEPQLERLLEQQQEYSDMSDLLEMLAELERNPIDLNQATAEQLAVLPWVSNLLAVKIINHRNRIGSFKSVEELIQIENVTPELLFMLRKYISVSHPKLRNKLSLTTQNRLTRTIETSTDRKDSTTYSSPNKFFNRFTVNYGNYLRFGLLLEKDSGEIRIDDLKAYFLSYRFHSNQNILIIGNYRLEFAQGLVFGNPYGYYKGNDLIFPAKQHGRELLGYTIVDENASLYGISAQVCFKIYQFLLFLSSTKLDATLNDNGTVKNFYTSGYHRTSSELDKKDRVCERLVGGRIQIKPTSFSSLGATYYRALFNPIVAIADEDVYRFHFQGKVNQLFGFDYSLTLGQFNLFGEFAHSQNYGSGLLAGIFMETKPLEFLILGRNYAKNFISYYGNSFGEQSGHPQNEQGIYCGIQFKAAKNMEWGLGFDQYRFPWRTYYVPMPASGNELFIRTEWRAVKNLTLSLYYKVERKEQVIPVDQDRLRIQFEYQAMTDIKLRGRFEKKWVTYNRYYQLQSSYLHHFKGVLLYQDIVIKLKKNFDLAARLTLFDTDEYESRLYQFEHDVPGMLTNQMLYGRGTRGYIRIQWQPTKILDMSIKFGSTQYHQINSKGSDSELKSYKSMNSISLQLITNW